VNKILDSEFIIWTYRRRLWIPTGASHQKGGSMV